MAEKKAFMPILAKYSSWPEAHLRFIIGLTLWATTMLIVFFIGTIQLSDRIQAASMITLVFITLFYAVQTQRLVDEERKKRNAEFGVRRIKEFLFPLSNSLESLKFSIARVAEAPKDPLRINFEDALGIFNVQLNGVRKLFIENLFMTNPILRYGYLKISKMTMLKPFEHQSEEFMTRWGKGIDENIDELRQAVDNEITRICQDIRKTYGFFSRDPESSASQDDLVVLSDKPPTII